MQRLSSPQKQCRDNSAILQKQHRDNNFIQFFYRSNTETIILFSSSMEAIQLDCPVHRSNAETT